MINLTFSADTRNRNVGLGDEAGFTVLLDIERLHRDRDWWVAEAARIGTDWRSLTAAVLEVLVSAGIIRLEQSTITFAPGASIGG